MSSTLRSRAPLANEPANRVQKLARHPVRLPEREGLLVAWRSQRRVSVSLTSRDWLGLHVAPDQWSDADREAAIRIVSDFAEEHGAVGIVLAVGYRNAVYASGAVQDDPLC